MDIIDNNRILLVEDDSSLAKGIVYALEKEGFNVVWGENFNAALELIMNNKFDLAILDIMLPDGNGFDLCKSIRKKGNVPVIFLSACDEEVNVIMGLDMGGDDYITKPFRVKELISRIKAVMRRNTKSYNTDIIEAGFLTIDISKCRVKKANSEIYLTATEYRLLLALIKNMNKVLTREKLLEILWDVDGNFIDENTLSVYIRRLREKIEDDPANPKYIKTLRGLGYKWSEDE